MPSNKLTCETFNTNHRIGVIYKLAYALNIRDHDKKQRIYYNPDNLIAPPLIQWMQ